METQTGVATRVTRVAADDWYGTEEEHDNEHNETVRHDGPVPKLTPVH